MINKTEMLRKAFVLMVMVAIIMALSILPFDLIFLPFKVAIFTFSIVGIALILNWYFKPQKK